MLFASISGTLPVRKDLRQLLVPIIRVSNISDYIGAHGIIVVYDVTDKESFRAVDNWMADVEKFASESAIRMLVGNKCDAEDKRKVTVDEGRELAARYNIKFLETSAKNSSNVGEAFQTLSKEIKSKVVPKKATTAAASSMIY